MVEHIGLGLPGGLGGFRPRLRAGAATGMLNPQRLVLTGVVVSVSGAIGFVELIVPHGLRLVVGGEHRRLVPLAVVGAAAFLVWTDVAARMVLAPRELPIGVVTGSLGAPQFVALLLRQREGAAPR
jgi:iron complex transport system permease protein